MAATLKTPTSGLGGQVVFWRVPEFSVSIDSNISARGTFAKKIREFYRDTTVVGEKPLISLKCENR